MPLFSIPRSTISRCFVALVFLHLTPVFPLQSMPQQEPKGEQPQSPKASQGQDPAKQPTGISKPAVRKAVSPSVREVDLGAATESTTVKKWEPGTPVRVVDDLKTSEEAQAGGSNKPVARTPVTPESQDQNLADLPKQPAPDAEDPVRVIDDLKQDPPSKPQQPAKKSGTQPKKP